MISPSKVYISRSKAGSLIDSSKFIEELSKYNVEILEYTGGTYNFEKIDLCDYLIVIPPNDKFTLGKGQSEEICRASERGKPVFLISDQFIDQSTNELKVFINEIYDEDLYYMKEDWKQNWASVLLDYCEEIRLNDIFKQLESLNVSKETCKEIESNNIFKKLEDSNVPKEVCKEVKKRVRPMLATINLFLK